MTTLPSLRQHIAPGESETIEFNRSTEGLRFSRRGLCAFSNGAGRQGVIGVVPGDEVVGPQVSGSRLQDLAAMRGNSSSQRAFRKDGSLGLPIAARKSSPNG